MTPDGFAAAEFAFDGTARRIFRRGHGPGVVIMPEVPGVTPEVVAFARRVSDAGFTVVVPDLFGVACKPQGAVYSLSVLTSLCVRREFYLLSARQSSPITHFLRALCRSLHAELGGVGVGAIGMCITGNFALSLMVDGSVMAPVLSQPSLPLPLGADRKAALHISDADLAIAKQRAREGLPLLALRFTCDRLVPDARFDRLRREFGDALHTIQIDSSKGNPHGLPRNAHSVLTRGLLDPQRSGPAAISDPRRAPDQPCEDAIAAVIAFFRTQLVKPNS
ncbi:MAG: dienelactone hydrolase family protein [Polyangiales bacterium]